MNARELTAALGGVWRGHSGSAPCPVCQPERRRDQNALSVRDGADGRALLYCFKNWCSFVDIAKALSLPLAAVHIDLAASNEAAKKRAVYSAEKLKRARNHLPLARKLAFHAGFAARPVDDLGLRDGRQCRADWRGSPHLFQQARQAVDEECKVHDWPVRWRPRRAR